MHCEKMYHVPGFDLQDPGDTRLSPFPLRLDMLTIKILRRI